MLYFQ